MGWQRSFRYSGGEVVSLLNTDQAANNDLGDKQLKAVISGIPVIY